MEQSKSRRTFSSLSANALLALDSLLLPKPKVVDARPLQELSTCPLCGARVRKDNMAKHKRKTHSTRFPARHPSQQKEISIWSPREPQWPKRCVKYKPVYVSTTPSLSPEEINYKDRGRYANARVTNRSAESRGSTIGWNQETINALSL